jgi:hypothetical protein
MTELARVAGDPEAGRQTRARAEEIA